MCQHKLGMSERAACRVTGKPAAPNNEHPDVNGPMILIRGCVTRFLLPTLDHLGPRQRRDPLQMGRRSKLTEAVDVSRCKKFTVLAGAERTEIAQARSAASTG